MLISLLLLFLFSPRSTRPRIEDIGDDIGVGIDVSCTLVDPLRDAETILPEMQTPVSGGGVTLAEQPIPAGIPWDVPSGTPVASEGGRSDPAQGSPTPNPEAPVASMALVMIPILKLFRARKLPIRRSAWYVFAFCFNIIILGFLKSYSSSSSALSWRSPSSL